MTTMTDLTARLTAATTYAPAWIAQQLAIFGDDLIRVIDSDRYAGLRDTMAAKWDAPIDGRALWVSGNAQLVYWLPELRDARARHTEGQARRFVDLLSHLLYWDASGGRQRMPGGNV